jgi:hypothetical protein
MKVHGLLIEPPEHDAPETSQPPKVYPELVNEYEIDTGAPTFLEYVPGARSVVPPAPPIISKEYVAPAT